MRGAAERGHLVVALGDFNMIPLSLAHRIVTAHAPVRDVWRVLHPDSSLGNALQAPERARGRPVPTGEFNLVENGATSDGVFNTWRWSKSDQKRAASIEIPLDRADPRGKRIDYIFAGCGRIADGPEAPREGWVVQRAKVGMTQRHPQLGCSLSDHFAVEATLVFHSGKPVRRLPVAKASADDVTVGEGDQAALHKGAYLQTPTGSEIFTPANDYDAQLAAFAPSASPAALPAATYDEILSVIQSYAVRERSQRVWRAAHFWASLVVAIGCWAAIWFSPANYVAFILILVSTLGLVSGVVDGLISLLFFNWELRALKEFEWEILNAKAAVTGGLRPSEDVSGTENGEMW